MQSLSNGQHSLIATAPSGGFDGSREEAVEWANAYCGRYHQAAIIDGFYDHSALGPLGEHTSSIIFTCTAPHRLQF